jgi:decaprenylphospho-beta-D-erythro-pentofuranosid-2-ulose 2-reductase
VENAFGQPQSIVVLGGTSDIAQAITDRLVKARTRTVVLAGRDQGRLDAAATRARAAGATNVATVTFDATNAASAEPTVAASFSLAKGPVDLVIVAVGDLGRQLDEENDATAAARIATVNFTWPVAALAAVRGRLVAQGSGRILVFSSVAAIRVRRTNYLYGGAKAGLDRLCSGLADSLIGTGVRVQIVRPAFVRSKMTTGLPEPPFTTDVDAVADAVLAGLSTHKAVITSPSILAALFLALRHLPAPWWRRLNEGR